MRKFITLSILALSMNAFCQIPTNGLVAYYPFNGNANDESGSGNNGTFQNGAILTSDRFGISNSAAYLDGVNDYINLPSGGASSLNLTGDLTVSFWIKTSDNAGLITSIGDCVNTNSGGYTSGINAGNVGNGKFAASTRGNPWNGSSITIADNQWHNIVYTLSGGNMKYFVDNVLVGQFAGYLTPLSWNGNRVIGCRNDLLMSAGTNLNGAFDDLTIYSRELSLSEISQIYSACTDPTATITPQSSTTICQGSSVLLSASTGTNYTYEWYKDGNLISGQSSSIFSATENGAYSVKVIDGACSTLSSSTTVTVNPNPIVSITNLPNHLDLNSGVLSLTGSPAGGTFSGNGVTSNNFNPISASLGSHDITYTYTDGFGCVGTTSQNTLVYDTLGTTCTSYDTTIVTQSNITTCFSSPDAVDNSWTGGWSYKEYIIPAGYKLDSIYGDFDRAGYPINEHDFIFSYTPNTHVYDVNTSTSPLDYQAITTSMYDHWIDLSSYNYTNDGVIRLFLPMNTGATWNNLCFASSLISGLTCTQTIYDTITTNVMVYDTTFVTITDTNYVTITDTNFVTITDTTFISVTDTLIINAVLGLPSPNETNIIKIYPNPASTHITINTGNFALMNGYKIRIDNSLAQVVYTTPINQQDYFVDLSSWSGNGTYFVYILDSQNNIMEVKKIILQ